MSSTRMTQRTTTLQLLPQLRQTLYLTSQVHPVIVDPEYLGHKQAALSPTWELLVPQMSRAVPNAARRWKSQVGVRPTNQASFEPTMRSPSPFHLPCHHLMLYVFPLPFLLLDEVLTMHNSLSVQSSPCAQRTSRKSSGISPALQLS